MSIYGSCLINFCCCCKHDNYISIYFYKCNIIICFIIYVSTKRLLIYSSNFTNGLVDPKSSTSCTVTRD